MPDDWELLYGLNAVDPTDALTDLDGDALNNFQEWEIGTNPLRVDTDGDGLDDGIDDDPLVPESQKPTLVWLSPDPQVKLEAGGVLTISVDARDNGRVARVEAELIGTRQNLMDVGEPEWSGTRTLPHQPGRYILYVRAFDLAGNREQISQILDLQDLTPPSLRWESPISNSTLVAGQLVEVRALATDTLGVRRVVIHDEDTGQVIAESQGGALQAVVSVPSGPAWRLRATAEDTAGNMTIQTRQVSIAADSEPPHILAVLPAEGALVSPSATFPVEVTAVDLGSGLATLEILVGATSTGVRPFGDGSALVTAPATPGPFVLTVRVSDRTGNTASLQRTVETSDAERDPPVVVIVAPATHSTWLHHQDIPVVVDASDASAMAGVTFAVDGVIVQALIQPPFATVIRAPATGSMARIAVEASDVHGNTARQELDVTLIADVTPPLLRLDPPDASRFAPGQQIIIITEATDDAGVDLVELRIDGNKVALDAQGRAIWQAPADPGEVAVELVGRDRSGNIAQITAQWVIDAGIALWFVGPLEGQALYAGAELPVEIGFSTAVDPGSIQLRINGEGLNSYSYSYSYSSSGIVAGHRYIGLATPSADAVHIMATARTLDGRDVWAQHVIPVQPWPRSLQVVGYVRDPVGEAVADVEVWSPGAERVRSAADGSFVLSIPQGVPQLRERNVGQYMGDVPVYAWSSRRGAVASGAMGFLPTISEVEQGQLDAARRYQDGVLSLICWPHPGADLGNPVVDARQPLDLAHPWAVDGGMWMQVWADPLGRIQAESPPEGTPYGADTASERVKSIVSFLSSYNYSSGPAIAPLYVPFEPGAQVYWLADDRGSVATWALKNANDGRTTVTRVRFRTDGSVDIMYPNAENVWGFATFAVGTQSAAEEWRCFAISSVHYQDSDSELQEVGIAKLWSSPRPHVDYWNLDEGAGVYEVGFRIPFMRHGPGSGASNVGAWGPLEYRLTSIYLPRELIEEDEDYWETEANVRSYVENYYITPEIQLDWPQARGAVLDAMNTEPVDVQETHVRSPTRVTGRVLEGSAPVSGATIALGHLTGLTDAEGRFMMEYDRNAQGPVANRWYVDPAAAPGGDGRTWGTAFTAIEDAALHARPDDVVWVAAGTYLPRPRATGDPRQASFWLPKYTRWHGGFLPGAVSADQADPWRFSTILSGDIGVPGDASDNTYRVVSCSESIALDGFVVRGGRGNSHGAGLYSTGSAIISRCWFDDNQTINGWGGGVYASWYVNCFASVFTANSARNGGAVGTGTPNFTSCVFLNNRAIESGGAIRASHGGNLTRITFDGNQATSGRSLSVSEHQWPMTCQGCIFDDDPQALLGLNPPLDVMRESFWRDHPWGDAMLASKPVFQAPEDPQGPDGLWATSDDGFLLAEGSAGIDAVGALQHWDATYTDIRGLLPAGAGLDAGAYERDGFARGRSTARPPWWEYTEPLGEIAPLTITVDGTAVMTLPAVDLHGANIIVLDDIDISQAPPGGLGALPSTTP